MTELERYKLAYTIAMDHLANFATTYKQAFDEVNAILNPPLEFEEVPVERWECNKCGSIYADSGPGVKPLLKGDSYTDCGQCGVAGMINPIYLTGTIRRPVPQKVEQSVSVEVAVNQMGEPVDTFRGLLANIGAQNPDAVGKRGTLTFTWAE